MERKFRSLYIGALAVIIVGLLGTVLVPKAHAGTRDESLVASNHRLQNSVARRSSDNASSNLLVGVLGLGFLSLSGTISLFAKKSAPVTSSRL